MKKLILLSLVAIFSCSSSSSRLNMVSSTSAICKGKHARSCNCETFELYLSQRKVEITAEAQSKDLEYIKESIKLRDGCSLLSISYLQSHDSLFLYNLYDCGDEGYTEFVTVNSFTGKPLWNIREFFGNIQPFIILGNYIYLAGSYKVGKIQKDSGKVIWEINLDRYKFSRLENFKINGDNLEVIGATSDLDSDKGWKNITISIDLNSGKQN